MIHIIGWILLLLPWVVIVSAVLLGAHFYVDPKTKTTDWPNIAGCLFMSLFALTPVVSALGLCLLFTK